MSYLCFGAAPVHVFTNVFSFLNFLDVPVRKFDRTGAQEHLYTSALTWGRGSGDHCLTAGVEHRETDGMYRLATLTRNHWSYSRFSSLARDYEFSRRYFHGNQTHLQGGPAPWTDPVPNIGDSHRIWNEEKHSWIAIPRSFLLKGSK